MDASGGAARKSVAAGDTGPVLRLRRAGGDAVDWVTETFLGGEASAGAAAPVFEIEVPAPGNEREGGVESIKVLPGRGTASVTMGVEASGRVCLEVRVGAGAEVGRVLRELEEVERRLRSSAHDAAMTPIAARVDLSQPVKRRVVLDKDAAVPAGVWSRAGFEVG